MSASDPPPPPPELATAEAPTARTSSLSLLGIVLGVVVCMVLGLGLATVSLGYYSTRRFVGRAREAEGKLLLGTLSRGIVRCVEQSGPLGAGSAAPGLPPSAPAVPSRLADVVGKGFQSSSSDWADPTYRCADFALQDPQRFQIEWVRTSASTGTVHARGDENGDGKADLVFEIDIRCEPDATGALRDCHRGPDIRERR